MTVPAGVRGYHPPPDHYETIPRPMLITNERLGERVPLLSNSPNQWVASSGMILRVPVGSLAHGTHIPGKSDRDESGICIEPPRTVIGADEFKSYRFRTAELKCPPTPEDPRTPPSGPNDLDLTVYSLRRFMELAGQGNPNMLLILFAPNPCYINKFGEELRANRDMFLSKQFGHRLKDYMGSQRKRMEGYENTDARGRKCATIMIRAGLQGIDFLQHGSIALPMPKAHTELLMALREGKRSRKWALDHAERLEAQIDELLESSTLPDEPDTQRINRLSIDMHLRYWGLSD